MIELTEIDLAAALLRAVIGVTMIAHGHNHLFGPGGVAGTARWFGGLGLRPPALHAWTSGLLEMAAGVGLLLGLATPLWTAATVGVATVAGIAAHRPNGFFVFKDGYEYVLVLAVASAALAALGPGAWSLDHLVGIDFAGGWPALGVLAAGVLGALGLLAACWRPSASADG
ncbi:DoxX family protein [Streptosporangium sp. NBC_01810]|uniref:DoxX family protein n=1 Tax=Streptosporangium sp. NBC_01810 TaxID=2975951 RepID=UPI002DDB602D|nr:DoxX family protein [Streptosporangium sp. NBC_01810]WSA24617.1 DoxX family protein [Streptosporangium sp. NBC_01810]